MHRCVRRWLPTLLALAGAALAAPGGLSAQAGTGSVRGRVTDAASGATLGGVQVVLEDTRLGAITRNNGEYVIAGVSAGAHVVVTRRIGYAAARQTVQVAAGATATADFTLRAAAVNLDQVIVTGTAAPTSRRALGTSVGAVDSTALSNSGAISPDVALQGKIAGAQVIQNSGNPGGGGVSVRLRGTSSIVSGSEPLYIVDGVIVDNSSDQIVDLGARSNVQNRLADVNPADIERIEVIRGAAAAALYGSRANNGVVQIFTRRGRPGKTRVSFQSNYSTEKVGKRLELNDYPFDAAGNPVTRYDYQDDIFTTGTRSDNQLSFEGGSDLTTFYFGANYANEDGIISGSSFLRRGARLNLTQQVLPQLKVDVGANFVNTHDEFEPNGEQTTGVLTAVLFTPTTFDFHRRANGTYPFAPTGATFANPLAAIANFRNPQDVNHFIGNARAHATPLHNLAMDFNVGYDGYGLEINQFIPRNNLPSELGGRAFTAVRDSRTLNTDAVATLTTHAGDDFEFQSSIGTNYTNQRISTVSGSASNLLPSLDVLSAGATTTAGQSRVDLLTFGYYGQQTVSWRDRLYLNGAVRVDGSSTFGRDQRYQTFPKLSASYVVSDEPFFQRLKSDHGISSLRLRSAIGYAGNQPSLDNAYAYANLAQRIVLDTLVGISFSTRLGNPGLKPERSREIEGGFDLGLFHDRASLEVTAYDKRVSDLLLPRQLRPSSGYISQLANIGEMSNKGLELLARTVNVDRPMLRWESTVTYSTNRNRVDKLIGAPFTVGYANRVQQGQPIGIFYGQYYQRNADGSIKVDPNTGRPLRSGLLSNPALQQKKIGDPNPDFLASLLNEFKFGSSVHARILFDGSFGNDVLNFSRRILDIFGTGRDAQRELLPLGDPRRLPAGYVAGRGSIFEEYVEDGSYVKLREISLSYALPTRLAGRAGLGAVEITASGRNLYTWTRYSGYDPETNLFGTSTVGRGNDFATYPIPRVFTVGARLTY